MRYNNRCGEVKLADYFALIGKFPPRAGFSDIESISGFIISIHAYPGTATETLAAPDVGPFAHLLLLYIAVCNAVKGRLWLPAMVQATWIRNPGPTGSAYPNGWLQGCFALGCNISGNPDNRAILLQTKQEQFTENWSHATGKSPMETWAEDLMLGEVQEYGVCAKTDPWNGCVHTTSAFAGSS